MDWREIVESKRHYTDIPLDIRKELKTLRTWAKEGYVPISADNGVRLYSNWYHNAVFMYYHSSEVRQASPEELKIIFAKENKRRNERNKIYRERRKQEEQEIIESLKSDVSKLDKEVVRARSNYHTLCKKLGEMVCDDSVLTAKNIVLDIETTGFSESYDEVLQVSIVDAENGTALYNEYFKPFIVSSWEEAEAVNHITAEMVRDKPLFAEAVSRINAIISKAECIIGYSVDFDIEFLKAYGVSFDGKVSYDVMERFATVYGEFDYSHQRYKWKKLSECAEYLGYDWGESNAHDSLADCNATLYCYNRLQEEEYVQRYDENARCFEERYAEDMEEAEL